MIHPELNMDTQPPEPKKTFAEKLCPDHLIEHERNQQ